MKTHILIEVTKVQPDIWILKGKNGVGFGVIGSVAALVREGLIEVDARQPIFHDKYVYTFLSSARTSFVYDHYLDALIAVCKDKRVDSSSGLARYILSCDDCGFFPRCLHEQ